MVYKPKSFALLDSDIFGLSSLATISATTYTLQIPGFSWREKFTIHIWSANLTSGTDAELEVEGSVDGQTWHVIYSYNQGSTVWATGTPPHPGDTEVIQESAFPYMRFRMKNPTAEALYVVRVVC